LKILIVDDEEHVREGVQLSMKWADYQIEEVLMADNGLSALEIIRREAPDLVICDMSMPIMDGVTFLKTLREEGWDSRVIVLSGYQEYQYTRATLQANGIDYLLKPFKIVDLERAVAKAIRSVSESKRIQNDERRKNYQLYEANMIVNEQKMAAYLQSEIPNYEGVRQLLHEEHFPLEHIHVLIYLPKNLHEVVERYYGGDEALYYFSMKNIVGDVFKTFCRYYFFRMDPFICIFVADCISDDEVEFYQTKLLESWSVNIKLDALSARSKQARGYAELLTGIREAKTEIVNAHLVAGNVRVDESRKLPSFMDKELLLLEALKNRDKQYIAELIHSFARQLRELPYLSLRELQHCSVEVNLLIMRISADHPAQTMPLWICNLDEWEKAVIHSFWSIIESEGDSLSSLQSVHAVRHYIDSHIGTDLTLASLSKRFHFSPQYLSKKFKESYRTTIMSYLTNLRMEKAKSLLIHSDMSMLEIAQLLSYDDDNYFGKVFRKHTGVSPTQFRRNQRTAGNGSY